MKRIEPRKPPHACDQCDATFWYPSHLKLHRKRHQKTTIFECQNCQKNFVKKKYYEKHIRSPCARTYFVPDRSQKVWTADLEPQLSRQREQGKGLAISLEGDRLPHLETSALELLEQNSESAPDASATEIEQHMPCVVVKNELQEDLLKDAVSIEGSTEASVKEELIEDALPCWGTMENSAQNHRSALEKHQQDEAITANMLYWCEDNETSRESLTAWSDQESIEAPIPKKARYDTHNGEQNVDQLGQLLKMWHLFDELYEFLKDKGLTVDGLRYMKERHIDETFRGQKLNAKIIFEHKLSEWQNEQGIYYIRSLKQLEASKCFQASQQTSTSSQRKSISDTLGPTHNNESNSCPLGFSVRELLNQTLQGKRVLSAYAEKQALLPLHRKLIVHEVVEYLILRDFKMTVQLCRDLAHHIVAEFPTECIDTYFRQSDRKVAPKSKLWDQYHYKKSTLQRRETVEVTHTPSTDAETPEQEKNLGCLKIEEELKTSLPWSEVWLKWVATIPYRTLQLNKAQLPLQQILKDWPLFKSQRSPELVDIDYNHMHSNHTFQVSRWARFNKKAPEIFQERIKNTCTYWHILRQYLQTQHTLSRDNQHIYLLMLLHAVLPPTTVVVNRKQIKYSIMDSYYSFTRAVKNGVELEYVIQEKKSQCQQSDFNPHPYMIVLGELNAYREFYVVLDDAKFSFPTYLEALQHCFKLFRVLNLEFPNESHAVWLFVEKYLFGMDEGSLENPAVDTLINDYNKCLAADCCLKI